MALEYELCIKEKLDKGVIDKIVSELNWQYIEEDIKNRGTFYSFTSPVGFQIFFVISRMLKEMEGQELTFESWITFRFINNFPFTIATRNMLRFALRLIKAYDGDFLFLFNGETVLMRRTWETGLVLSNAEFWNAELLNEMKDMKFTRKDFKVL